MAHSHPPIGSSQAKNSASFANWHEGSTNGNGVSGSIIPAAHPAAFKDESTLLAHLRLPCYNTGGTTFGCGVGIRVIRR